MATGQGHDPPGGFIVPVHFVKDEEGSTPIEYAMIASLIAVAIFVALVSLSENTEALYDSIASAFQATSPTPSNP